MAGVKTVVAAVAGVALAGLVARQLSRNTAGGAGAHSAGWKSMTVLGSAEDFAPGGAYPGPLAEFADAFELRMLPAPGNRGTEVHARVRPGVDAKQAFGGRDPEECLRVALRDAKQLVETGEILRNIPRPHGRRPNTIAGHLVDAAEEKSKGKGIL